MESSELGSVDASSAKIIQTPAGVAVAKAVLISGNAAAAKTSEVSVSGVSISWVSISGISVGISGSEASSSGASTISTTSTESDFLVSSAPQLVSRPTAIPNSPNEITLNVFFEK